MIALAVLLVFVMVGAFDSISHFGKAYGNVTVNGVDVSGKNADEIKEIVKSTYWPVVSQSQVTVYANEEAAKNGGQVLSDEERRAIAEQISTEEAVATIGSWQTDALTLKAEIPYDQIAKQALAVGRDDGGVLTRLGLLVGKKDIPVTLTFDQGALETLASDIDRTVGEPRKDTTVGIADGEAYTIDGQDGMLVDRSWLAGKLSGALLSGQDKPSFIAEASLAHSRITHEQAQKTADEINRAIKPGAVFTYQKKDWTANADALGSWTDVEVVENNGSYDLKASINNSRAIPAIVKGAGAVITSDDMLVTFEKSGDDVRVHTSGSGNIPEVSNAAYNLNELLYGSNGAAFHGSGVDPVKLEIAESDRPESLGLDEAIELGVITVIGEYTTEFSNQEGTENRNHNIKLVADILNDGIVKADGGTWDFNDRSGNTNENAGFWMAGSIVDGEYVDSVGGGICQVATTIFNAAYEAGLPIVERHNHSLYIASYPTGRDAAVDYPTSTLIWKNEFPSDILLHLDYTDNSVTAKLYSVYTGYTVSTETGEWKDGAKYSTRFEVDNSLGTSYYYRKTTGSDGSSIVITRTVKDDSGNVVSTNQFSSVYSAKDEIYVVGSDVDTSKLVHTA